jgi:uncharacterized protein (TIGR02172 family)
MSVLQPDPSRIIGEGLTADVYAWDEGRVLKLFHDHRPSSLIDREFRITQAVKAIGVSAPAAYKIVEINGRRGIVFDRVEGQTVFEYVKARPWKLFAAARQLAELHAQLHGLQAPPELPSQIGRIASGIEAATAVSEEDKQTARRLLGELPEGEALCHGDFHPDNVFLTRQGPVIIDWSAATRGHPLGDVARTSNLFQYANLPESTPLHIRCLFKASRAVLHSTYLNRYLQLHPGTRRQIEEWQAPLRVAASAWPRMFPWSDSVD